MESLFDRPRGIVMWGGGGTQGPKAIPGDYTIRLSVGEWSQEQPFTLAIDPRRDVTVQDYQYQYDLAVEIGDQVDKLWSSLEDLRRIKQSMRSLGGRIRGQEGAEDLMALSREVTAELEAIEMVITQVEGEGGQDALNFPGRLDNQWAALYGAASGPDTPLSAGVAERFADLQPETDALMTRLQTVFDGPLVELNAGVASLNLDAITMPQESDGTRK